jgi:hypothetical protein
MVVHRILVLVCALILTSTPTRGQSEAPFSIRVKAPAKVVELGSDITVQIVLTNASDHELHLWKIPGYAPQAEFYYAFDVRDDQGRELPETEYGRRMKSGFMRGSRISYTVAPGESVADEAVMTKLYNFSQPGKYTVQISRSIAQIQGSGKGVVRSNTIAIELVEKKPAH